MLTYHVGLHNLDRLALGMAERRGVGGLKGARGRGQRKAAPPSRARPPVLAREAGCV